MFIEHYRLEQNPFSADGVRPIFHSHSYRHAALHARKILDNKLHCLFISGAPHVGKTTLVEHEFRSTKGISVATVAPGTQNPAELLINLVESLGPGAVEGSAGELRQILTVFLQHQFANGRRSLIVADGLESMSPEVMRELENLMQLRSRNRPLVQFVATTRNEELVENLLGRHDGSAYAPALHQRLLGFTLDETATYLRASLQGAGSDCFEELISSDLSVEIQAFTQGIVGDLDALMSKALEALAKSAVKNGKAPALTLSRLKAAAAVLHLKYDASAWKARRDEVLVPGAVHESDHTELRIEAARLSVSSGGRAIAEVSLNRPRMILGRDSNCDISLDSSYVSRYQNLFMETQDGWMLIDLNSTNGCFVNGRRVHEHRLKDGDLISLGQHQLRFSGTDRSAATSGDRTVTSVALKPDFSPR